MPCAAFEDVPIRVRSTAAGMGGPQASHPTTIKLATQTNTRNKTVSADRWLDGETLRRCDGRTFARLVVLTRPSNVTSFPRVVPLTPAVSPACSFLNSFACPLTSLLDPQVV